MAYQSKHTGDNIDKGINLALSMYPVGSIYLSVNNVNPGTIFGGTWEQIQDRFLLAAGSTYAGGATGGTASHTHTTAGHTLTVNEMPSHTHTLQRNVPYGMPGNDTSGSGSGSNSPYYKESYSPFTILATGGGASHSHGNTGSSSSLPPYLAIYVWKRTA